MRLYDLAGIPFWTDELFTRFYAGTGLSNIWLESARTEPTPPLYYTLIWALEHTVGAKAWILRLPSVAGSLAGIALAAALARELWGRRSPALLAALLLTVAPLNIYYAQEARAYALQGAALALALLGLARVLRGASGFGLYIAGAVAAVWLHPTSVLPVAAMNVGAGLAMLGPRPMLAGPAVRRWIVAGAAVVLLCLPLLPNIVFPPDNGAATSWIPPLTRASLESVIGETLAGPALVQHAQGIAEAAALGLVLLALLPPWRPGWRAAIVLVLVPGLTVTSMVAVSVFKPIVLGRTLAWTLIPLAVALGGILSRRPLALRLGVVALPMLALAVQLGRGATLKEDWPGLFAAMAAAAPPAFVVLGPHSPPAAATVYQLAATGIARLEDPGPAVPETALVARVFGTPLMNLAELRALIESGRPLWLVFRRPEHASLTRDIADWPPPTRELQSEEGSNPALRALYWSR